MKKFILSGMFFMSLIYSLDAQDVNTIINKNSVEKILSTLAADDMRGRKTFTPDIDRAADYIAQQFKETGLQYEKSKQSYFQDFSIYTTSIDKQTLSINGKDFPLEKFIVVSTQRHLEITHIADYNIEKVTNPTELFSKSMAAVHSTNNTIVLVDSSCSEYFPRLKFFTRATFQKPTTTIFILANETPKKVKLDISQNIEEHKLKNVLGIIPGKTLPNEYVIFSGHYDHLGVDSSRSPDSIYNGANDDASGTTAVIELAKYYKKKNDNARTLIFVAFTAEEIGGYGSQYFSSQYDPSKVMAMFNIEMIGTESKWGKNSAYITGFEKSNMGTILQSNLKGSKFQFYPDPYTKEQLFYRSDNATLARQGVPAHTISTSKMDNEPTYHQLNDDMSHVDLNNMTEIIKSIAVSAQTIIAGKDTPTRVDAKAL